MAFRVIFWWAVALNPGLTGFLLSAPAQQVWQPLQQW